MKKLLALILVSCLILTSGCSILVKNEAVDYVSSETPSYTYELRDYPSIAASSAIESLAVAVTASMLGITSEKAYDYLDFSGTEKAWQSLLDGDVELVIGTLPSDEIIEQLGTDYKMQIIAADGLVFYVHDSAGVTDLSFDEIYGIYTGEYTNWSELGGNDIEIVPCVKSDTSASGTAFSENFAIEDLSQFNSNVFEANSGAISYTMYQYFLNTDMESTRVALSVDGVTANFDTITEGTYEVLTNYYVACRTFDDELEPTALLYTWLASAKGQRFISTANYVADTEGVA